MEKLKDWIKRWLNLTANDILQGARIMAQNEINTGEVVRELKQRIQDLEDAYPGYKQAKADAEKQEQSEIAPGFVPFSQRKRQFEASRRRPDKK